MEVWQPLEEFPNYSVSNFGNVINLNTNFYLTPSKNQHGVVNVGMMKNGVQCRRSLSLLVANAFLPRPVDSRFDALIHKDGNREHNFVDNLEWRPRPWVHYYYDQFRTPYQNRVKVAVLNVTTGEVFANSWEAAKHYGVLESSVVHSILNEHEPVFPIGHLFDIA